MPVLSVLFVQESCGGQCNVELARGAIGIAAPGHCNRSGGIVLVLRRILELNRFACIAGSRSIWAPALNNEPGDVPVKGQSVIEPSTGELDEIPGRNWSI